MAAPTLLHVLVCEFCCRSVWFLYRLDLMVLFFYFLKESTPAAFHLRFESLDGGVSRASSDFFLEADFLLASFCFSSGSYRALLTNRAAAPLSRRAAFFFSVISFTLFMHILILSWKKAYQDILHTRKNWSCEEVQQRKHSYQFLFDPVLPRIYSLCDQIHWEQKDKMCNIIK